MTNKVLPEKPLRLINFETALKDMVLRTGIVLPHPLGRMDQNSVVRRIAREQGVTINTRASDGGFAELNEKLPDFSSGSGGGGGDENIELREDGGIELREDGGFELREGA